MRARAPVLGVVAALLAVSPTAAGAQNTPAAQQSVRNVLHKAMVHAGGASGAYVLDLTTGQALFSSAATVPRTPASVEKLYTTSTALLRFGPGATFTTSVLGTGSRGPHGTWLGTLYLRGGGDPTFGSASFDRDWYGGGTTIQRLVAALQRATHINALKGRVIGDGTYFDSFPGTSESGFQFDPYMEGSLSALSFNRGLLGDGSVANPARYAAQQLVAALRDAHIRVPRGTLTGSGRTPVAARLLAVLHSPTIAQLIALTNTPSDNFVAETLLKDLGAEFGGRGSTAAGAAIVRSELTSQFGIRPTLVDGSGLSRVDATTPTDVVTLLSKLATNTDFVNSLAVGGESGTLSHEMQGTPAQDNCRGKTGTLSDVATLAGYCQALDGHTLVFAFLMNSIGDPNTGHAIEAGMAADLARYDG